MASVSKVYDLIKRLKPTAICVQCNQDFPTPLKANSLPYLCIAINNIHIMDKYYQILGKVLSSGKMQSNKKGISATY